MKALVKVVRKVPTQPHHSLPALFYKENKGLHPKEWGLSSYSQTLYVSFLLLL